MSESFREHRPLLRENNSDEEVQQDFSPPLRRHMGFKGKARNTAKGAAAIIKNWPDYWSSSVTYWWIGIAMFALMTFVLYNSVVTYSLLPAADSSPTPQYSIEKKLTLPDIFMHVLVNNEKEADLNKYLPYIQILADKYLHYKFNLIIMLNDTFENEQAVRQAQLNNEDAMNSLWTENRVYEMDSVPSKSKSNINIQYVNLSNYLEGSPLREYWKKLPNQLVEFLVRAVSIWDKGGVAISPIILTPRSPDAIYIEKLYSLLSLYEEPKKPDVTTSVTYTTQNIEKNRMLNNLKRKQKKKVNNIRDIIDDYLSYDDTSDHKDLPEVLSQAENRPEPSKFKVRPLKTDTAIKNSDYFNLTGKPVEEHNKDHSDSNKNNQLDALTHMLPSFLDLLFHTKPNKTSQEDESTDKNPVKRTSRAVSTESSQENDITDNVIQPMIISAPLKFEKASSEKKKNAPLNINDVENLTIDLKGNILATKSPCHAFLGSMFSNVKRRSENDSLKDFIIAELSLFCNGLLSTCKGIDVILI